MQGLVSHELVLHLDSFKGGGDWTGWRSVVVAQQHLWGVGKGPKHRDLHAIACYLTLLTT